MAKNKPLISDSTIEELKQAQVERQVREGRLSTEAREMGYTDCPDCGAIVKVEKSGDGKEYRLYHIFHRS